MDNNKNIFILKLSVKFDENVDSNLWDGFED